MKLVVKDVQVYLAGGFLLFLFLFCFLFGILFCFVLGLFYFVCGFFHWFCFAFVFFSTHAKENTKMTFFILKNIIYL